jgi:hypothetical protein
MGGYVCIGFAICPKYEYFILLIILTLLENL